MNMYLAFSTGAMMASILKRLTKRKTDIKPSDLQEVQKNHPEEMNKTIELVKNGGIFDKFISDVLLKGIDPSYNQQFINWAWVAFADGDAFDKYFADFDENRIDEDTHLTTGFQDRISDFCLHSKKHAIYKQQCREILNLVNAKPNHITVEGFCEKMIAMNDDWDTKKKYTVNEDTIGESWRNIEKNEIRIGGNWGDFRAYKVPSWTDLMQTCNQTSWCVAQKGASGLNYYKNYGEPYYLICDGRREPFALLNPPSHQFKDIKDNPIKLRSGGNALPSHRRAIYFGKEVYDKVSGGSYAGDLSVFDNVEQLKSIDEKEKNDTTNYHAIVDGLGDDEIKNTSGSAFIQMMNADSMQNNFRAYNNVHEKYKKLSPEEKKTVVEDLVNGARTDGAMDFIIDDMIVNDGERLLKLVEKNKKVIQYCYETNTIDYITELMKKHLQKSSYDSNSLFDECNYNFDDIAYYVCVSTENKSRKNQIINFILDYKNCTKNVVDKVYDQINFNNIDTYGYLFTAFEQGKIDKSAFDGIEEKLKQNNDTTTGWSYSHKFENRVMAPYLRSNELCPDSVREDMCKKTDDEDYDRIRWEGNNSPLKVALENGTGKWVDEILQSVLEQDKNKLESHRESMKYITILNNKKCTKEIIDGVLEILEYGKGYKIEKPGNDIICVYASILNSGFVDNEQFMKILKTNPRIIVRYGWKNEHCTDAIKLVLAKKVGKLNGQIFHFGKDENPLVLNEFFRSRINAGRYAEFYSALGDDAITDELLRFALMKINTMVNSYYNIISRICNKKNLSDESKLYVYGHKDECKNGEGVGEEIKNKFFASKNVQNELIVKAMDENDLAAIATYLKNDNSKKEFVEKIAEKYAHYKGEGSMRIKIALACNKYCPDELIGEAYEQYKEYYDKYAGVADVFTNVIRHSLIPANQIAKEFAENNRTNDHNLEAVLKSEKFSTEEKTSIILEMDFKKLSENAVILAVKAIAGMKIFKKVAINLNHKNNEVGRAFAENEAYSREQLQSILNKNYGVTEGYYNRFGVDEAVLRAKYLHKLIDNHYCDFTKRDKKAVLNSGNEDAIWLIKQSIRRDMKIHSNIKDASRFRSIALRVALNEKMGVIAKKIM